MIIRQATNLDMGAWLVLRKVLWPNCTDLNHNAEMLDYLKGSKDKAVYLAESEPNMLVGFLEVSIRHEVEGHFGKRAAYLEGIYVEPSFRHKQIGRKLVLAAEQWALENGCSILGSDAEIDNEESLNFHKKLDYKEANRLVHFIKELKEPIQG